MWQTFIALDVARERAAEAEAWRRASRVAARHPSWIRRITAGTLRTVHDLAAGLAASASQLAERVEGPAL